MISFCVGVDLFDDMILDMICQCCAYAVPQLLARPPPARAL